MTVGHRIDHIVIAVTDLDRASEELEGLGFDVRPGGRHEGRGTRNAIIRFGLDYLELLTVEDPDLARRSGLGGAVLVDQLETRGDGLLGFMVATDDIDADALRLAAAGVDTPAPFAMRRQRPDGSELAWRLLTPRGQSWRRPWPTIIEWDMADEERLAIEAPGRQANGAQRITRVVVATSDLDEAVRVYRDGIGAIVDGAKLGPGPSAVRATVHIGAATVDILGPALAGAGPVADLISAGGEGTIRVELGVEDPDATREWLLRHGHALRDLGPDDLAVGSATFTAGMAGLSGAIAFGAA